MRRLLLTLVVCAFFAGCYYDAGFISVRRETIEVGRALVGDSVHAKFRFKNKTADSVRISFMPECYCTTVSIDSMELAPGMRLELNVSVAIESAGEFRKYVFVQDMEDSDFLTIAIEGRGE